jgi:hypothetical protein
MFFYLLVIIVALFLLSILVLRFVQPEIIYIVREQLIKVGISRVVLEQEANRGKDHNERYNELTLKEFRYETLGHTAEYALDRAGKIRELYSVMDAKRAEEMPELEAERRPQICIVELANLLHNMGWRLTPRIREEYKTIKADAILRFIALQICAEGGEEAAAGQQNAPQPLEQPSDVVEWFQKNPISIEQAVEILLAAVHSLAYRLREEDPKPIAGSILVGARKDSPRVSMEPNPGSHPAN